MNLKYSFLHLLIDDLGCVEISSTITFMSDQQKGLLPALQELLPGVEQRFCVRHIYANFRKRFPGKILKRLLWKAAASTHPQTWEAVMREIKGVNPDAFKYLIAIPPRFWSRSRFTSNAVCDTLVNNMSEAFNSVILHARGKPIITMMEDICLYLMKRWATNRNKISTYEGSICPKIKKRFDKELHLTKYWIPSWSGEKIFEVRHISMMSDKYVVDIDKLECSCRKWTLTAIPCCHALAAMTFININGEDYVPHWFTKSTYQETYIPIIYPVNGPQLWETTSHPDVLPPTKRVLPGRPKKKRRLEPWELKKDDTQLKQNGTRKRCSICRQVGHKRNSCPQAPPANQTQYQSSEQPATQAEQSQPITGPSQLTQASTTEV
ncbi:uncharacterized protein LOC128195800 [Vigna angularis]|uniref:uncharacterized protein LOC128195800 n=1 Tax=Phaseolus angularis TaxID=3914 RepID=UPI0022B3C275|nr:uncharacterized protein LOC128195800 [Vigna angularis]